MILSEQYELHSLHHGRVILPTAKTPHPTTEGRACRSSGGCVKRIRRARLVKPLLLRLRKYDAQMCIIFTEGYRSGHNEAVLKTRAQKFLLFPQNPCNIKVFRHFPAYKNFIVLSRNSLQIPEHFAKDTLRRVIEVVITRRS